MLRDTGKIENINPPLWEEFYDASVTWIKDLKDRHDPDNRIGILSPDEVDPSRLEMGVQPAYRPSQEELDDPVARAEIQSGILNTFRYMAAEFMGTDNFNSFSASFLQDGISAQELWKRRQQRGQNSSTVLFHPNIVAMPLIVAGETDSFSRAEFFNDPAFVEKYGKFDLFDYSQQNIIMVNPALEVASYNGYPVIPFLAYEGNVVKVSPPTSGAKVYSRELRKFINEQADNGMAEIVASRDVEGKSTHLYLDPTGSTMTTEEVGGNVAAVKRKRVSIAASRLINGNYSFTRPVSMFWHKNAKEAKSYVGSARSVEGEGEFNALIAELDSKTAEMAGVDQLAEVRKQLGKIAI